jgi:hypothetical protein
MGREYRYVRVKHAGQGVIALLLSLQGRAALAQPPEATTPPPAVYTAPPPQPAGPPPALDVAPSSKSEQLEKDLQNPLAKLVTVPVEYTTNFEVGPEEREEYHFDLKPIVPISLGPLDLIVRTILPLMSNPDPEDSDGRVTGLGDMTLTAYIAPSTLAGMRAGIGPAFLFPTGTDDALGSGQWGIGPSLAVVGQPQQWTLGALITQLWSFAGEEGRPDVNRLEIEPLLSYRLGGRISVNYAGIITADWEQSGDDRWTLPVGGTVSYLLSALPIQVHAGGGVNAVKPDDAANWFLRLQATLFLPGG